MNVSSSSLRRGRLSSTSASIAHNVSRDGGSVIGDVGRSSLLKKAKSNAKAASSAPTSHGRGTAAAFLLILNLCFLVTVVVILPGQGEASPTPVGSSYLACSDNIRGGGECGITVDDDGDISDDTRKVILRFLNCATKDDKIVAEEKFPFHIQGWRWHFMSLIRDSRRLERLSMHLANLTEEGDAEESGFDALSRAANYVINFNMAGLFRIQSELLVNFLRRHLCDEKSLGRFCAGNATAETDAFEALIQIIDNYRARSEDVGRVLYQSANAASKATESSQNKKRLLGDVARSSKRLVDQLALMRNLQETFIVPAISRVIPSNMQKSFNSKVLRQLGLLESRLHLVGMHDAVWESGIEVEKMKFEEEIPFVARMMIERWRQSLYIPKAGALDYGLTTG
ncbi:hypothetical protein ACHAXA_001189 [Cyclostephanos tholiformis]|uniref:Uncharacterized protein n=1 Tax=Cyclostephanos tholiformis TaxID=382380 RepID=A0ABD3SQM9_9STRA